MAEFCCDRHGDGFCLQKYLPSFLYAGAISIIPAESKRATRNRPTWEREALDERLVSWAASQIGKPGIPYRQPYDILSDTQRDVLIKAGTQKFISPSAIVGLLDESSEWAALWSEDLYKLICEYQDVRTPKPSKTNAMDDSNTAES